MNELDSIVPLERLLDDRDLGMRVIVDGGIDDRCISLVATTEMAHLTEYVVEDQLVLTAGAGLGDTPEAMAEYVGDLRDARVAALGFGLEPLYDRVPEHLIDACRRAGVTLVSIDRSVPFHRIVQAFAIELQRLRNLELKHVADRLKALVSIAAQGTIAELLDGVATDGVDWAALVTDAVIWRSGRTPRLSSADLHAFTNGLLPHRGVAIRTVESPEFGSEVVALAMPGSDGFRHGAALVLGRSRRHSTHQTIFTVASSLFDLVLRGSTDPGARLERAVTRALITRGDLTTSLRSELLDDLSRTFEGRDMTICLASLASRAPTEADIAWWRRRFGSPFVTTVGNAVALVVSTSVVSGLQEEAGRSGWTVRATRPFGVKQLDAGAAEARLVLAHFERTGSLDAWPIGPWASIFLDGERRGLFASAVLGRLDAAEPEVREQLIPTLYTWLEESGSWERTARRRGVHRNTVRRVIAESARILDVDLDDARTRASLLIALDARTGGGAGA